MDFSRDCRIATQLCTPLRRHPWLDIPWQERKDPIRGFFQGLQNRYAIMHVAKPPSMAQYSLARTKNLQTVLFFQVLCLQTRKNKNLQTFEPVPKCHAELDSASPKLDQNMPLSDPPAKSRFFRIPCCIFLKKIYVNFYIFNF